MCLLELSADPIGRSHRDVTRLPSLIGRAHESDSIPARWLVDPEKRSSGAQNCVIRWYSILWIIGTPDRPRRDGEAAASSWLPSVTDSFTYGETIVSAASDVEVQSPALVREGNSSDLLLSIWLGLQAVVSYTAYSSTARTVSFSRSWVCFPVAEIRMLNETFRIEVNARKKWGFHPLLYSSFHSL